MRRWSVIAPGGMVALLSSSPIFSLSPETTLAMTVLGAADARNGRVVAQRDCLLGGWPGIEATIQPSGLPALRFRAYHLKMSLVTVGVAGGDSKDADRLFDSLALDSNTEAGPLKTVGPTWERIGLKPFLPSVELPTGAAPNELRVPALANPMRRWDSTYGNRTYAAVYLRLPSEIKSASESERMDTIKAGNTEALRTSGGKVVRRTICTLAGLPGERLEATLQDGTMAFIVQTAIDGDLILYLSAAIPTALKDSPEVARFFGSLQLGKGASKSLPSKPL